jgi:hypothetical protein
MIGGWGGAEGGKFIDGTPQGSSAPHYCVNG